MPAPVIAGGLLGLGALLRVLLLRFFLVAMIYAAFSLVFQIAGKMFFGQGFVQSLLEQIGSGQAMSLSDAFSTLPACAAQIFFFMELNDSLSMVGATFTAILGMRLFGKVMETLNL